MGSRALLRGAAGAGTVVVAAAVNVATGMLTQRWAVAWWAATGVLVMVGGGLQWWLTVAGGGGGEGQVDAAPAGQEGRPAGGVVNTISGSAIAGTVIQSGSIGSVGGPARAEPEPADPDAAAGQDAAGSGEVV